MFRKILILLLGIFLIIFGVFKLKKDKPIEEPGYLKFLNGNALVKENKNQEALEEYKIAMDTNEDLNIKKNFEIIKNKVDKEKQDQQQNNKDQQDDNKQNQQNDKNQQNNQDNKNNSQNNKQNEQQNDNQDNKQNNQNEQQNDNQDNKQENQQNNGNKQQNQGSAPKELTPEEKAMKQKEEELRSIMQRLEGNEKQAFKNNERVLNTSENKNSENRW